MSGNNDPPHTKIYRAFRARPFFWVAVVQIIFIAAKGLERIVPLSPVPPQAASTAAKDAMPTALSKKSATGGVRNPTFPNTAQSDLTKTDLLEPGLTETEGVIEDWPQMRRGTIRFTLKTPLSEKIAVFADPDVPPGTAAPSPLAKGLTVRLRGRFRALRRARNPGEFDYSGHLLTRGIRRTFRAREVDVTAPAGAIDRLAATVRAAAVRAVGKHVPGPGEASLLLRMLIGSSEVEAGNEESEERFAVLRENFAIAGVAHVLVISGLHVGYVAAIFWFIFRLGGVSKKTAGALALPFIWLYAAAAGGTTPVVRAAAMATSLIISATALRGYDSYQAIGLASVITLSLNPSDLFSPGFQLSYAATFGIIHFSKYARSLFGGMNRVAAWTLGILWMSFSAQLFTTPIISHYFGRFSTVAFIANLIVVPAAGAALAAGLAALMLDLIFEPAASVAGYAAALALGASSYAVDFLSKLPRASVPIVPPSMISSSAWYMAAIWAPVFLKKKKLAVAGAFVSIFIISLAMPQFPRNFNSATRITFLSGEGECSLIEIPDGSLNILIDAGGRWDPSRSAAAESYIPFLKTKNIRRLDAVFITGADLSRYGALEEIMREIPVTRVYVNPDISLWPEYVSLMETLDKKRIPVIEIWAPWRMSSRDFSIVALNPARLDSGPGRNALVLMAKTAGARVYFAAGADDEFEERFAKRISDDNIGKKNHPRSGRRSAVIVKIPRSGARATPIIIENLGTDYAIINSKPDISMLSLTNGGNVPASVRRSDVAVRFIAHSYERNTPASIMPPDEGHRKKRFFLDESGAVGVEIRKNGETQVRPLIKTRARSSAKVVEDAKDDTKNQKNRNPLQFVQ